MTSFYTSALPLTSPALLPWRLHSLTLTIAAKEAHFFRMQDTWSTLSAPFLQTLPLYVTLDIDFCRREFAGRSQRFRHLPGPRQMVEAEGLRYWARRVGTLLAGKEYEEAAEILGEVEGEARGLYPDLLIELEGAISRILWAAEEQAQDAAIAGFEGFSAASTARHHWLKSRYLALARVRVDEAVADFFDKIMLDDAFGESLLKDPPCEIMSDRLLRIIRAARVARAKRRAFNIEPALQECWGLAAELDGHLLDIEQRLVIAEAEHRAAEKRAVAAQVAAIVAKWSQTTELSGVAEPHDAVAETAPAGSVPEG